MAYCEHDTKRDDRIMGVTMATNHKADNDMYIATSRYVVV